MQGLFACEEGVCGNDMGEVGTSRKLCVMGDVSVWLGKQCGFECVRCEQMGGGRWDSHKGGGSYRHIVGTAPFLALPSFSS